MTASTLCKKSTITRSHLVSLQAICAYRKSEATYLRNMIANSYESKRFKTRLTRKQLLTLKNPSNLTLSILIEDIHSPFTADRFNRFCEYYAIKHGHITISHGHCPTPSDSKAYDHEALRKQQERIHICPCSSWDKCICK